MKLQEILEYQKVDIQIRRMQADLKNSKERKGAEQRQVDHEEAVKKLKVNTNAIKNKITENLFFITSSVKIIFCNLLLNIQKIYNLCDII